MCKCLCHNNKASSHADNCCLKSAAMRTTNAKKNFILRKIVEASIADAFQSRHDDDAALRQQAIQKDIEDRLKNSTFQGKGKEKLDKEADDPTNTGAPTRGAPAAPNTQQASAPQQQQTPAAPQAQGVIDADSVIDQFNIIRSGRSLNDRDVTDALKQYMGSLAPGQLQATFGILQQIAGIVQPAVPPRTQAPVTEPPAVKNDRLQMLQQKTQQAQNVAQQTPPPAPKKLATKDEKDEDTTPPIKVGSRTSEATKRELKLLLVDR